jgi:hypothetical protein
MVEISFIYQENDCANRLYGKIVLKMVNVNEINIHNLIKPIIINAINSNNKLNLMPKLRKLKIGVIGVINSNLRDIYEEIKQNIFDLYIICNNNNEIEEIF